MTLVVLAVRLHALDAYLANKEYVQGFMPTQLDVDVIAALTSPLDPSRHPHAARYVTHMATFSPAQRASFRQGGQLPAQLSSFAQPASAAAAGTSKKVHAATKAPPTAAPKQTPSAPKSTPPASVAPAAGICDVETIPLYFADTYQAEAEAVVISVGKAEDSALFEVVCDATIFHPQGGGQPGDVGVMHVGADSFNVSKVYKCGVRVIHQGTFSSKAFCLGSQCKQVVEKEHRLACARLHSAGHLIDQAMVACGYGHLKPLKGYHFLDAPYVEYQGGPAASEREGMLEGLNKALADLTKAAIPTAVHMLPPSQVGAKCLDGECTDGPEDKLVRVVCVGGEKGCPCGGTHVANTSELAGVEVKKLKVKKGNMRVSYIIAP